MYLIVDHDSFTYNLADLVAGAGRDVEVRPCDALGLGEIAAMKPDGLIISPVEGACRRLAVLSIVREFGDTMPILGIVSAWRFWPTLPGLPSPAAESRCTAR